MIMARYRKDITEIIGQDPEHLPERADLQRALLELLLPFLKPEYAPAPESGIKFRAPDTTYPNDPNDVRAHAEFAADVTIVNSIAEIADHLAHAQAKPTPAERQSARERAVVRATVLTTGAWMLQFMVMREDFIAKALARVNSSKINDLTLEQLHKFNIHDFVSSVPDLVFTGLPVLYYAHTSFSQYQEKAIRNLDEAEPDHNWENPYKEAMIAAAVRAGTTALRTVDDLRNGRHTIPDPLRTVVESTRTALLLEHSSTLSDFDLFPPC